MPTFNPQQIIKELEDALKGVAVSHAPEVIGATSAYLIRSTERLTGLAEGDFESDYIKERLAEEGDILKSELSSYEVFGQMLAKDAQDTTITKIITTILTVLGQVMINQA